MTIPPVLVNLTFCLPRFSRVNLFGDPSLGKVTLINLLFVQIIILPFNFVMTLAKAVKLGGFDLDQYIIRNVVKLRLEDKRQRAKYRKAAEAWFEDSSKSIRQDNQRLYEKNQELNHQVYQLKTAIDALIVLKRERDEAA